MAQNLSESSTFAVNIPSIEDTDSVTGSPTVGPADPNFGAPNRQAVAITNRTKWLNDNKSGLDTLNILSLKNSFKKGIENQYTVGCGFANKSVLSNASGKVSDPAALNQGDQKVLITFDDSAGLRGWIRILIHSTFLDRSSFINAPLLIPVGAVKHYMIGSSFGESALPYPNIPLNSTGQQDLPVMDTGKATSGLHLFTDSGTTGSTLDNQFDGSDVYLANGLIIIEKTQISIRNPSSAQAILAPTIYYEINGLNLTA